MIGKEAERMLIMGSKAPILIFAWLICFLISNSPLVAQSRDRNNPTPLLSPEIKGFAGADSSVYWYKLTAGPGELVMHMSVGCWGSRSCGVSARFVLWDKNMQEVMDESLITETYFGEGKTQSLRLQSKQDFLLSIGQGSVRGKPGTYRILFKGAIDFPPEKEQR